MTDTTNQESTEHTSTFKITRPYLSRKLLDAIDDTLKNSVGFNYPQYLKLENNSFLQFESIIDKYYSDPNNDHLNKLRDNFLDKQTEHHQNCSVNGFRIKSMEELLENEIFLENLLRVTLAMSKMIQFIKFLPPSDSKQYDIVKKTFTIQTDVDNDPSGFLEDEHENKYKKENFDTKLRGVTLDNIDHIITSINKTSYLTFKEIAYIITKLAFTMSQYIDNHILDKMMYSTFHYKKKSISLERSNYSLAYSLIFQDNYNKQNDQSLLSNLHLFNKDYYSSDNIEIIDCSLSGGDLNETIKRTVNYFLEFLRKEAETQQYNLLLLPKRVVSVFLPRLKLASKLRKDATGNSTYIPEKEDYYTNYITTYKGIDIVECDKLTNIALLIKDDFIIYGLGTMPKVLLYQKAESSDDNFKVTNVFNLKYLDEYTLAYHIRDLVECPSSSKSKAKGIGFINNLEDWIYAYEK